MHQLPWGRPWLGGSTRCARLSRGMVTAELAVGLIVTALVLAVCSGIVGVLITQGECEQVATQVARQAARGDQAAAKKAQQAAPRGSRVIITTSQGWVSVVVSTERSWGRIGPVAMSGRAQLPLEPGQSAPGGPSGGRAAADENRVP